VLLTSTNNSNCHQLVLNPNNGLIDQSTYIDSDINGLDSHPNTVLIEEHLLVTEMCWSVSNY
jgi:hypothetical protein